MKNDCNTDLQIWTLSGDPGTSLLNSICNSICNKGGYTKEIWKDTTNKAVPINMISFVRWKDIE